MKLFFFSSFLPFILRRSSCARHSGLSRSCKKSGGLPYHHHRHDHACGTHPCRLGSVFPLSLAPPSLPPSRFLSMTYYSSPHQPASHLPHHEDDTHGEDGCRPEARPCPLLWGCLRALHSSSSSNSINTATPLVQLFLHRPSTLHFLQQIRYILLLTRNSVIFLSLR